MATRRVTALTRKVARHQGATHSAERVFIVATGANTKGFHVWLTDQVSDKITAAKSVTKRITLAATASPGCRSAARQTPITAATL